jgi:hypothetical protein
MDESPTVELDYGPDPCITNGCPCRGFTIHVDGERLIVTIPKEDDEPPGMA